MTAQVLVACKAGVSRSVSFVAALLMREEALSLGDALQAVRSVRRQVCELSFGPSLIRAGKILWCFHR